MDLGFEVEHLRRLIGVRGDAGLDLRFLFEQTGGIEADGLRRPVLNALIGLRTYLCAAE